ncbi:MAG: LysR substrate-binding domain-containing protein, partial [Candidatus Sericytochromatia bacterium]
MLTAWMLARHGWGIRRDDLVRVLTASAVLVAGCYGLLFWGMVRVDSGTAAVTLRIGIQNDLVAAHLGALIAAFRTLLPQAALYVEPDYSTQMCADLVTGGLDFAILFTPKPQPDLFF